MASDLAEAGVGAGWIEIAAPDELEWRVEGVRPFLVHLDKFSKNSSLPPLPPVPVIGAGDPDHPLAARLDCLVEPPAGTDSLAAAIAANPQAAGVLVMLLRGLEGLEPRHAVTFESLAYGVLQSGAEHRRWRAARGAAPASAPDPGRVTVARSGDRLEIVLDRPWAHNAIDVAMRDALSQAFALASLDPAIREVRLTGCGRAFSVGADLGEFGTTTDPLEAHMIRMQTLPALAALGCADRLVARIDGAAIGAGIEIAAFARRIEASAAAHFQLPELRMGLIPGAGGCVSIARRVGRQRLALMVLSGRRVSARLAHAWGLVDVLVD